MPDLSMNVELLDYFDENIQWQGVASREEVHQKGWWHKTFHCWILGKDEIAPYLIFQERSPEKMLYPNKLDISAAGHLLAGESPEIGARELAEELGVSFEFSELIFLGIRTDVSIVNQWINKEFCYTFFLVRNLPLHTYQLQKEELSALCKIYLPDGFDLISGEKKDIQSEFFAPNVGMQATFWKTIQLSDLLPHPQHYYLKILIMAERYFEGKKYLTI